MKKKEFIVCYCFGHNLGEPDFGLVRNVLDFCCALLTISSGDGESKLNLESSWNSSGRIRGSRGHFHFHLQ